MRIKVTEIEATAEELRQCNSLADGFTRMMKNIFNPYYSIEIDDNVPREDEDEPQTDCAWR